jgi:hypothetical protein
MQMPSRNESSDLPKLDKELRARLAKAFREARISRIVIAEKLSPLINREITVSTLNDYTTMKERVRFPACYVAPLADVLDSDPLERFVLRPHRHRLLLIGEVISKILDERIQELLLATRKKAAR